MNLKKTAIPEVFYPAKLGTSLSGTHVFKE